MTKGASAAAARNYAGPGTTTVDTNLTHVYGDDYTGVTNRMVWMIKQGDLESAGFNSSTLTVSYNVVDISYRKCLFTAL